MRVPTTARTIDWLLDHHHKQLTAGGWCVLLGVNIIDDDGWRKDGKSLEELIGLDEFLTRFAESTTS